MPTAAQPHTQHPLLTSSTCTWTALVGLFSPPFLLLAVVPPPSEAGRGERLSACFLAQQAMLTSI